MPLYTFKDHYGQTFDVVLSMDEAPKFGEWINLNGKDLCRQIDLPLVKPTKSWQFKGWSQRPWAKGAEAYDAEGTPCFSSKKAVQRFLDTQNKQVEKDGQGEQGGEILSYGGKTAL